MISKEVKILGLPVSVGVPESIAEFDQLAGKEGEALDQANTNVLYRSVFTEVRSSFTEALETQTGIARKTKPGKIKKNGEPGEDQWDETEMDYFDRVVAESNGSKEDYLSLITEVASKIPFDPAAKERAASKPKTLAKVYLTAAQSIIEAGKTNHAILKLEAKLGWKVEPTLEGLANAIRDVELAKQKALAAEYTS